MAVERNDLRGISPTVIPSYDGNGHFVAVSQTTVPLSTGNLSISSLFEVGPDTKSDWSSAPYIGADSGIAGATYALSGDAYFAGWAESPASPKNTTAATEMAPVNLLANEPYNGGNYDAVIGKIDSTGRVAWIHFFGTANDDRATKIILGSNGAPIMVGITTVPASTAGATAMITSRFAASFSTDGTLLWSSTEPTSIPGISPATGWTATSGAATDVMGNFYEDLAAVSNNVVRSFRPDGTLRFTTAVYALQGNMAVTPDGSHLYTAAAATAQGCTLTSYSTADGSTLWKRTGAITEVFTPDRSEYWVGSFESCDAIAATADTIFIAGAWGNVVQRNSAGATLAPFGNPRGTFYVGAYDLDGNKKWFVQLLPVNPTDDVATDDTAHLFLDSQGNPLLLFTIPVSGQTAPSLEVAHLSAVDGTLLP